MRFKLGGSLRFSVGHSDFNFTSGWMMTAECFRWRFSQYWKLLTSQLVAPLRIRNLTWSSLTVIGQHYIGLVKITARSRVQRFVSDFGPDRIRLCWVIWEGQWDGDALNMLDLLSEADLMVSPDPPIWMNPSNHHYGLINKCAGRIAEALGNVLLLCYLWPAIDNAGTSWLLDLGKASLQLVIGFITRHCKIRSLTRIWNYSQPNYFRLCWDKEKLKPVDHRLCPALGKFKLRTLGRGFYKGLNFVFSLPSGPLVD